MEGTHEKLGKVRDRPGFWAQESNIAQEESASPQPSWLLELGEDFSGASSGPVEVMYSCGCSPTLLKTCNTGYLET